MGRTRPGDVKDSQADITRARKVLGYEPIVSFEDGLRRTVEWFRETAGNLPPPASVNAGYARNRPRQATATSNQAATFRFLSTGVPPRLSMPNVEDSCT